MSFSLPGCCHAFALMPVNLNLLRAIFLLHVYRHFLQPTEGKLASFISRSRTVWSGSWPKPPLISPSQRSKVDRKLTPPFIQKTLSFLLYFPEASRHFKGGGGMICRRKHRRSPLWAAWLSDFVLPKWKCLSPGSAPSFQGKACSHHGR